MKKHSITILSLLLSISFFVIACNKGGSDATYTCTCSYHDPAKDSDIVSKSTYPLGTSKETAQIKCDSNNTTVKVIDPVNGGCAL